MRAFIAVFPPAEAAAHLADAVEPARVVNPSLRWQPPDRWHVTLAFLGGVDPTRIEALVRRLHEVALGMAPLPGVRIAGSGRFGGVLWLGMTAGPQLHQLARACRRGARAAGAPVDRARFVPHLTVARSRGQRDPAKLAAAMLSGYIGPEWTVGDIALVESLTGPSPQYRRVAEFALGSGRLHP